MEVAIKNIIVLVLGSLAVELFGYFWHRFVCHSGVLRSFLEDVLRRRHFDHHENKYPDYSIRVNTYQSSCDISFRVLGGLLAISLILARMLDFVRSETAAVLAGALLLHAIVSIRLHSVYHLPSTQIERLLICRVAVFKQALLWLRDFHDVHHIKNANYSLIFPIFDLLGGTFISPKKLRKLERECLFPGFDPRHSSPCDGPLL